MADSAPAFDPAAPFDVLGGGAGQSAPQTFDPSKPFAAADSTSFTPEPTTDYSSKITSSQAEAPSALKSLGTGMGEGAAQVIGNLDRASDAILSKLGLDTGGAQRYARFKANEQRPDIAAALNSTAGETGKIIGEIGETAPLAALTENPWIIGGASGALTSESDTPGGVLRDTGAGMVGGKLGDVAAKGVGATVGKVVNRFAPNVTVATSPASQPAARQAVAYVGKLMDDSGVTPTDLVTVGNTTQKPVTAAEVIGKPGTTALGALARRDGTTGDVLDGVLKQRATQASSRMLDDYAAASGVDPRLARGDIEDYVATGRKTVAPMFDQALGTANGGKSPAVWNQQLAMLSQRPAIQRAMGAVSDDLANAGKDPAAFGFTGQDPNTGKFIQMPRPTAEAWDMVKKRVGTLADRDAFGKILPDSASPGNYNLNVAGRDLTGALRKSIPGYGDALDASGDYLSMKQAFDDGSSFVTNPKVSAQQVVKHLQGLTAPERESFKGGIASQLFDQAQNGRLNSRMFFRTQNGSVAPIPALSQKLQAALGQPQAQTFLAGLDNEGRMAAASNRMRPGVNSPTAEFNEAIRQQDSPYTAGGKLADFAEDVATGGPKAAVKGVIGRGVQAGFDRFRTAGMPAEVRNEAGRLLMMHPTDLGRYLQGAMAPATQQPWAALSASVPAIRKSVAPALIGSSVAAAALPGSN